nr:TPA: orf y [Tanacetum cinerariifolium]GEV10619.1 TPA: orf y [Tanacetum cinerariifolium]
MLVLPAEPCLWSDVISRWESITINRLNSQTWSDNTVKLAFMENLLRKSEKLMWQQWRTAYQSAYSALETIVYDPQNITSQVRQLIIMEDPYRGSTDEQDRAYRDLDRITCEETKNLWSFLEDFWQLAIKSRNLYFPSTTEKIFAKLPPSLSKKIEESFKAGHPGLSAGEGHFAKDCRSKQGNIARSAVYQELDLNDNWDIVSADFDDSNVYNISKREGDVHQNINIMVQDTPFKEATFLKIEEINESDDEQSVEKDYDDQNRQVQQMIKDQAKEYYENRAIMQKKEELWLSEKSMHVKDFTDAFKIIDQLKIEQISLEEQKDKEIRKLKTQLQKEKKETEAWYSSKEFPPLGNSQIARPFMKAEVHYFGNTITTPKIRKITNQL